MSCFSPVLIVTAAAAAELALHGVPVAGRLPHVVDGLLLVPVYRAFVQTEPDLHRRPHGEQLGEEGDNEEDRGEGVVAPLLRPRDEESEHSDGEHEEAKPHHSHRTSVVHPVDEVKLQATSSLV